MNNYSVPPIDRFTPKLASEGDCWIWTAGKSTGGYGFFFNGKKNVQAHRWSYEFHVGPIPEGLTIDHLCRVKACVNPYHLEPVTQRVNSLRAPNSVNAIHARTTHCPRNHEYSSENTYVDKRGRRYCRTCSREHMREYRAN